MTSVFKSVPTCPVFQCCSSGVVITVPGWIFSVYPQCVFCSKRFLQKKKTQLLFVFKICVFMYMCLFAFMCMYHVCAWCLRVLASLELDLRMVCATTQKLGTKTQVLCKSRRTLSLSSLSALILKSVRLCMSGSRQAELVTEPRILPMLLHLLCPWLHCRLVSYFSLQPKLWLGESRIFARFLPP